MIETLNRGTRKAHKEHQCFNCYRPIATGTDYSFGVFKYDGIYTIKSHKDCEEALYWFVKFCGYEDFGDGYPPLLNIVNEDFPEDNINALRGYFPHVACRLEFHEQKRQLPFD